MAIRFPSLEYFQGLQQRTKDAHERFEKLGYCDTTFGVRIGEQLYTVAFEVYECVGVAEGGDSSGLDFVLVGSEELWREMVQAIVEQGGADVGHTLNTLCHVGDQIGVEYSDPEGHDRLFRYMASLQEFFDQSQHLELEF